jgi:hypothetical protein
VTVGIPDHLYDDAEMSGTSRGPARLYVAMVLVPIIALMTGLVGIGLWLGPASGDLTRVGALPDADFFYPGPSQALNEPDALRLGYGAPFDGMAEGKIVVFGDSFAGPWVQTLQHVSGTGVVVVWPDDFAPVENYLRSDAFRDHPPRAVVVESIERLVMQRSLALEATGTGCPAPPQVHWLAPPPEGTEPLQWAAQPPKAIPDYHLADLLDRAILAVRFWAKPRKRPVQQVSLMRDDLFTNPASDQLLIINEDVDLFRADRLAPRSVAEATAQMRCGIARLADLAGDVPFRLMIMPDKRTAYARWIEDPLAPKEFDVFAEAEAALGDAFVDLRPVIAAALDQDTLDVYMANDTHWGYPTHQLAADVLIESLIRP